MSNETTGERNTDKTFVKPKMWILVVISGFIVVTAILVGVIVYLLQGKGETAGEAEQERPYDSVVTPDNVDEVVSDMERTEEELIPIGYYEVNMNTEWTFSDGKSASSNAYVGNAESNQSPVYFTIAPADDSEHIIYTSPLLLVGSHIDEIQLDEQLEKGTYDCVLTYHLMDEEDNEISTVSVSVNITIEN